MSKIVFIDRDGVINVDLGGYVTRPEDFRFEAGSVEALKHLADRGWDIIVISNQAGVGDGVFTQQALEEVHAKMIADLEREGIGILGSYYCLHGKNAGCVCRKPAPGLFQRAAREHTFEPAQTFFIGDKASDIEAGKRFGLKTILVRTGYGRVDEKKMTGTLAPNYTADSLLDAVNNILFTLPPILPPLAGEDQGGGVK